MKLVDTILKRKAKKNCTENMTYITLQLTFAKFLNLKRHWEKYRNEKSVESVEKKEKFANYQFQESISKNEHIRSRERRKYLPETWSE